MVDGGTGGIGGTTRLLVVARETRREEIETALRNWGGDLRVFWVAEADLAPARAQDVVPHAILVDDAPGPGDAVALIRQLVARVPGAAILALVDEEAMDRARQAVLAGARGFVTRPLRAEDLLATLRQALAAQRQVPVGSTPPEEERGRGHVLVFCSPKGGSGRTTLVLNTAVSLHKTTQQPVVLVDADYAAPALDVALNLHSERNLADLLPRAARLDEDLLSGVLATHASGVKVLLAPPPGDLAAPVTPAQMQTILTLLRRMFRWVLVDLGVGLDDLALSFIESADRAIVSVLPELVGLRNAALLLEELRAHGMPTEHIWVVLNRATMRGGIGKGDIEKRLRLPVKYSVPDDQPLATYSINRGVPLVLSHRQSALARAIGQLATQLSRELMDGSGPARG